MNDNSYSYYIMSIVANMCQLVDFQMNLTQLSNDDLMKHLVQQDRILDDQTNNYLKKIIEQNKEIIELLKNKYLLTHLFIFVII